MTIREKIAQKQNEPEMLKCQYSARVCFNKAEKQNYYLFLAGILSALCVFIPSSLTWVCIVAPVGLDTIAFILRCFIARNVKTASLLRNFFDHEVLGLGSTNYSKAIKEDIREKIAELSGKDLACRDQQMSNTGTDNPPGVKDWYVLSGDTSDEAEEEILLGCQKQNWWWNEKLTRRRILICGIGILIIFLTFFVFKFVFQIEFVRIIRCGLAIIAIVIDRMHINLVYMQQSGKIKHTIDAYEPSLPDKKKLDYLQDLINERRSLAVLEMNWMHVLKNKDWSIQYSNRIGLPETNDNE